MFIIVFSLYFIPLSYALDQSEGFESGSIALSDFNNFYSSWGSFPLPVASTEFSKEGSYSMMIYDSSAGASASIYSADDTYFDDDTSDSVSFWLYNANNTMFSIQIIEGGDTVKGVIEWNDYSDTVIEYYNGTDRYTIVSTTGLHNEWLFFKINYRLALAELDYFIYNATGSLLGSVEEVAMYSGSTGSSTKEDLDFEPYYYGVGYFYVDDIQSPADSDPFESGEEEEEESYWWDEETYGTVAFYVAILIAILSPVYVLVVMFKLGKWGFVIGILFGVSIGYLTMPAYVPSWLVFVTVVAVIGLVIQEIVN